MGLPFDSAQGPPEKLNHKFYFLLNESCWGEEKCRKNNYINKEDIGKLYRCQNCILADFFCAMNYLKYKADWTVFLMAGYFVSCVKSFKGEGGKKRDCCNQCDSSQKSEKFLIIHLPLPSCLHNLYKVRRKLF